MSKEKWYVYTKRADFLEVAKKAGINPVVARLLRNRDIYTEQDDEKTVIEKIHEYIGCDTDRMHSPWLLKDMDKAVDILNIKINQNNKIRVICDYDIDGICSGFILKDALSKMGADVDVVVPHRINDGYGINIKLIDEAKQENIDTILTCDNGIAAYEPIEYAISLGMTVVVTDHHEVPFEKENGSVKYILPPANAVVDPKQEDCEYPFKEICGATVAYKLVEALFESRMQGREEVKKYLEYAAIATIGDVVPLFGENRTITKYGLDLLRNTKNQGLQALIDKCNIEKDKITSYHIGFVIGPCLNASGRLDTARKAIRLLGSDSYEKAEAIAESLKKLNDERKTLTEQGVKDAEVFANCYSEDKVLVIYLKNCHESIAGIIAGRIREKFNKPTIILTDGSEGVKGSGRSIENYNMYEELNKVKDVFSKFGGHKMAAGVSLPADRVDELRRRLNENCTLSGDDFNPKIWIDMELPFEYLNESVIDEINALEPFGQGNEKPLFAERSLKVKRMFLIGKDGMSFKLMLENARGAVIEAICFNKSKEFMDLIREKYGEEQLKRISRGLDNDAIIKITYYPGINVFNNRTTIQAVIKNFSI